MRKKNASATIYMIFFLIIFLAFCAFAVDGTIVLTNRSKLQSATEATALAAASEFNTLTTPTNASISSAATNAFNLLKADALTTATINVEVNIGMKEVRVTTQYVSQPYFLAFLDVSGITLDAKACAKSEQLDVTANYSGINWITASAAYESDVLSKDLNLNNTAILKPLGDFRSASYASVENAVDFGALNSNGAKHLSLGPGGFITIKLPAPIIDKPGDDLYIKEAGDAVEGYMVFAGIDNNPDNPYVQAGNVGDGISWINISDTGTPETADTSGKTFKGTASTSGLGNQDKFYGSGYFDIGKATIAMAKYIRIVDDNSESAYVTADTSNADPKPYFIITPYGEASTATAGADIDVITVLNHVRLMSPSTYTP